jgi:hypothetical protein
MTRVGGWRAISIYSHTDLSYLKIKDEMKILF